MKLLLLIGPSGSGKSTFAERMVKDNVDWVRVNRDNIREGLMPDHIHLWYKTPDRKNLEQLVTELEYQNIWSAFDYGYNVIVDATNLTKLGRWQQFIDHGHQVLYKKFEEPLALCKFRVEERDQIDCSYIDSQYEKFQKLVIPEEYEEIREVP